MSQRRLVAAVAGAGKPFVSVYAAGSALRAEEGNAVIQAWYPGQAGGTALADVLFGRVSPSGRLPVTFYRSVDDLPDFTDYAMKNRTYRYFEGEALYPFGFGLSYADIRYSDAQIEGDVLRVTVENASSIPAGEIVQAYIQRPDSPWDTRNASLCAFARIELAPGERKRVSLAIPARAFTVVDDEGRRIDAGRHFVLWVGGSQPDAVSVRLTGKAPLRVEICRADG